MSGSLFPEGAENVEEVVNKVHFAIHDGTAILCDTKNAKEATEDESKVTCMRCLKRMQDQEEILERGNIALVYNITVESPVITQSGKKVLQAWLDQIPDKVKLTFNHNYSKGNTLIASWSETRDSDNA
jgi:hypothetical protein